MDLSTISREELWWVLRRKVEEYELFKMPSEGEVKSPQVSLSPSDAITLMLKEGVNPAVHGLVPYEHSGEIWESSKERALILGKSIEEKKVWYYDLDNQDEHRHRFFSLYNELPSGFHRSFPSDSAQTR